MITTLTVAQYRAMNKKKTKFTPPQEKIIHSKPKAACKVEIEIRGLKYEQTTDETGRWIEIRLKDGTNH